MESSLVRKSNNGDIEIDLSSIVPLRGDVENLELSDFIIMATISYDFDNRLKYFFKRDSFTVPDPFYRTGSFYRF